MAESTLFGIAIIILIAAVFIYSSKEDSLLKKVNEKAAANTAQLESLRKTFWDNSKEFREEIDELKKEIDKLATIRHFLSEKIELAQRKADTAETLAHSAKMDLARLPKDREPERVQYEITLVDGGKRPKESLSVKGEEINKLKKKAKELSQ